MANLKLALRSIDRHRAALLGILIFSIVLVAHFPAVFNDFINFDDPEYVYGNEHVVKGLTGSSIVWAFRSLKMGFWHPATWLSLMVDSQIFGARAFGFHLTNVVLHAANAVLVFALLCQLTRSQWRSALVAVLFGIHPLHVEPVAWIAERKELLAAFFGLAALIAYGRYATKIAAEQRPPNSKLGYFSALGLFALSLMSKAMWITLPAMLLLIDWWPLKRISLFVGEGRTGNGLRAFVRSKVVWEKIPFAALAIGCGIVTFVAQQQMNAVRGANQISFSGRAANAIHSSAIYLQQMVWPSGLTIFYPLPNIVPFWAVVVSGLLVFVVSFFAIKFAARVPSLLFGWFWYLITLLPVIGLVQVGIQAHADRYAYVPLIGIFVALVWLIPQNGIWADLRPGVVTIFCVLLAVSFVLTRHQLGFWKNSEVLFRHALAVDQNNELAHNNLAAALASHGRFQEAATHLRRAVALKPKDAKARANLGITLVNLGNMREAIPQLQQALVLNPSNSLAYENLGFAFLNRGDLGGAVLHLQRAIQLEPDYAVAYRNLGIAVGSQGNLSGAIGYFQKAIALDPNDLEARYNLGVAYASLGRTAEAIAEYRKVIASEPRHADAENNLGAMLASERKFDEAIKHLQNALQLNPNHPDAKINLRAAIDAKAQGNRALPRK
jgi:protein O-mannosyl-transferase